MCSHRSLTVRNAGSVRVRRAPRTACRRVALTSAPPLPLDVDGEIRGHTPARITLAPNALRVMVAPGFPDT